MSLPPARVVSLIISLLGLPALAQPEPPRVETLPSRPGAEVRLAPGQPTTLLFDGALDQAAVELAARALGFQRVAVAEDTLTLVPAPGWREGDRLPLTVPFADGQPRGGLPLVFVVSAAESKAHVLVSRRSRTLAALEEELAEQQARCAVKDAEIATLHQKVSSLAMLVASGTLGREGIQVIPLEAANWSMPGQLSRGAASLYVATGYVAFEVELTLEAGARPWTPDGAILEDQAGLAPIHAGVVRLVEAPVLAAGAKARLVVEFAVSLSGRGKRYRFQVTEQNGNRTLALRDLELSPQPARKR